LHYTRPTGEIYKQCIAQLTYKPRLIALWFIHTVTGSVVRRRAVRRAVQISAYGNASSVKAATCGAVPCRAVPRRDVDPM